MYLYIDVPRPFKHGDIFIWSFSLFLPQPLGMFCGLSEEHQNLRPWPSSQGIFFGSETSMLFCVGCVPFFLSSHVICFGVYVSYINIQYIVDHIWYKYIYIHVHRIPNISPLNTAATRQSGNSQLYNGKNIYGELQVKMFQECHVLHDTTLLLTHQIEKAITFEVSYRFQGLWYFMKSIKNIESKQEFRFWQILLTCPENK